MCGRLRLPTDYSEIKIQLRISDLYPAPNIRPSWNIAPTQTVLIVRLRKELSIANSFGFSKTQALHIILETTPANNLAVPPSSDSIPKHFGETHKLTVIRTSELRAEKRNLIPGERRRQKKRIIDRMSYALLGVGAIFANSKCLPHDSALFMTSLSIGGNAIFYAIAP